MKVAVTSQGKALSKLIPKDCNSSPKPDCQVDENTFFSNMAL